MKVTTKCIECGAKKVARRRELPFKVGDRVVTVVGEKFTGKVVCPRISSDTFLHIWMDGDYHGPLYVVQFDEGHIQYMGEMGLRFEEE